MGLLLERLLQLINQLGLLKYIVCYIFAEIDLYFTGDTPQVDVNSIHVEFESNMNDLIIECHLKGGDKVDCEYLQ